jgi:large subunit ribosomal protein L22
MQVRAAARYLRRAPRKVRRYAQLIVGKDIKSARAILAVQNSPAARELAKVLNSAAANAETNHDLDVDDLWVEKAYADEALILPRLRPRARGRADRVKKRTCHLTVILTDGEDEEPEQ